ncbi:MAG: hypothetical protein HUJ29_09695 [Gammaproteobacteria bacterium]|nr:hypothetical protein [Gammaproteobacteria bacterium]
MRFLASLSLALLLQACAPTTAPESVVDTKAVSAEEYAELTPEQKYLVTNKLLTTLFKGMPVDDFFDVAKGLTSPQLKSNTNHLETVRTQLDTPVGGIGNYIALVQEKYRLDIESRLRNTRAIPMAVLQELPLGEEFYQRWMAYHLMNTILFSPAFELDSVDHTDVETIFNIHLVEAMHEGKGIRDIVYEHMVSQENWRRFRSPEDNTREMMEIYLNRFRDDEVPLASIACQNWYLTDDAEGYQLRKGINVNATPQALLDRNDIVSCKDFYRAVANHGDLIPTVTRRLVDVFFADYPRSKRINLTNKFAASSPQTFDELFTSIIFSREYLLQNTRTKSYEETLYGTGQRIDWYAWNYMFHDINDNNPGSSRPDLGEMRQSTMSYKLGRANAVPTDSLSLAYYHKSIRDRMVLDRRYSDDPLNYGDGGWSTSFINPEDGSIDLLSDEDFIHYVMLAMLGRKANATEVTTLSELFVSNGHENSRINQAWIIMDYTSRLSEFYTLPAIAGVN